jgi:NTE family protein
VNERALVLAGGGAAGNAWQLGLIAGLSAAGVDVTTADVVIGTSSGSTVAAQITGGPTPTEMLDAILAEVHPPRADGRRPTTSGPSYLDWSDQVIAAAGDPVDMRRRLGAAARAMASSDGSGQTRWRDIVAARLPHHDWPEQLVLLTAVDADSGDPVAFDRHSGIDLVDAVAASTSNGFAPVGAYRIGDRRYLNGGYRRSENADLAAGYRRVLVLSPFGGRSRMPRAWRMDLASQVDELRAGGSAVQTVFPGVEAGDVFDANALDPSTRPQAARGGYDQGRALAEQLSSFWR